MSPSSASREETFSRLFHATAEKYWQEGKKSAELIDAEGKAFLSSIGYTEQEFFDFIEDFVGIAGDALVWYRKAAEQGSVSAQSGLGYLYANGRGVERDYVQAHFWYGRAARQGEVSAQTGLGYLYANGLGVAQDYDQAAYWYRQAAEKGSDYAQLYLGYQYQQGQGVPRDEAQAAYWFYQAADQGNAHALEELKKWESPSGSSGPRRVR